MPSGRVHGLTSLALAAGFALAARNGLPPEWLEPTTAEALALGALLGIPLTPDLDLNRSPLAKRIFGPFYFLWRLYWLPYARVIGHRDWRSHFPIVGTLVRVLYLTLPAVILLVFTGLIRPAPFLAANGAALLALFGGLAASDALHALLDGLATLLLPVRRWRRVL